MSIERQDYYTRMTIKLESVQRSSKAYCSLFKNFLNDKKMPVILPMYHKDDFVTDSYKKLNFLTPLLRTSFL